MRKADEKDMQEIRKETKLEIKITVVAILVMLIGLILAIEC